MIADDENDTGAPEQGQGGGGGAAGEEAPPPRRVSRKTPPAVQAWLDGEETREHLTGAEELENVEFWTKINTETERLRRRSTPIHVQQKILGSLPDEPAGARTSIGTAPVTLSRGMALLAGAALLAAGVLIGALLLGG